MNEGNGQLVVADKPPVEYGSPLDMPVAMFRDGLDRRKANRKALMEWIRESLVEGTDFGSIQMGGRMSKPSLFKPGAEKICGMLGVTVTFPTFHDYEHSAVEGKAIENIILRCELLDGMGRIVATGAGARSVLKEKGDINKAMKMAAKSAHIDATLRLAGLSEIFTQDLETMAADAAAETAEPTPEQRKAAHDVAVDKYTDAIIVIKESIASGDLADGAHVWFELPDEAKEALWISTKAGGIFTTKERATMKSADWRKAHYGAEA